MNVPADDDRCVYVLDVRLLEQYVGHLGKHESFTVVQSRLSSCSSRCLDAFIFESQSSSCAQAIISKNN